jgi:SET domain-containing protein
LGVFSEQFIPAGSVVWQWHEGFDIKIAPELIEKLPESPREYMKKYGWIEDNQFFICLDNEQFINHSDDPNCIFGDGDDEWSALAARDIHIGDELTQNYKDFDVNFGLKEFGYDWVAETSDSKSE